MTKQLYRSSKNKVIGGVAGGLAEYFDVDPVIIRVIFVVSVFAWGLSLFVYIALWIFVPYNNDDEDFRFTNPDLSSISDIPEDFITSAPTNQTNRKILGGTLLIILGIIILLDQLLPNFDLAFIWPVVLIGLGGYIIYKASNKSKGI
jgi:phage shock protein C